MKAVVLRKPNDLAVLDVPEPEIGPNMALVRMTHCGICGSDIRYLRGDNPWAKQTLGEKRENPTNIILGHEAVGVVVEVGGDCDPHLIGKRAALLSFGTCGECFYCRRGEEHLCPNTQHLGHGAGWGESDYYYGGMAEYVSILAGWLSPLADSVSSEAAALLDPLGVAVHGLTVGGLSDGDTVLIIGGGPVGALAAAVAKAKGAGKVALVDVSERVLDIARRMGADDVMPPDALDASALAFRAEASGLDARVILDTVGADLNQYLPHLARGGRYVMMTVTDRPQTIRTISLAGERSISSSCNFQYPDYSEALWLVETGAVDPTPIITHRFALEDAVEAFRVAEDKASSGAVKVLLEH